MNSIYTLQFNKQIHKMAIDAGKIIMTHFRKENIRLDDKEDHSPLTLADLESQQLIEKKLKELDPTIPIISEEAEIPPYESRKNWSRFWLVDPLDGTKEFLRGNEDFTVNIALIEHGEPVLGTIYIPTKDVLYYAIKGQGSWKQEGNNPATQIFSVEHDSNEPFIVVESKSHPSEALEIFLKSISIKKRIAAGSSLKFCLLAEGFADIYPRMNPTMEWDVAAGDCIYRNSGRHGLRFSPLSYNKPSLKNDYFVIGIEQKN